MLADMMEVYEYEGRRVTENNACECVGSLNSDRDWHALRLYRSNRDLRGTNGCRITFLNIPSDLTGGYLRLPTST